MGEKAERQKGGRAEGQKGQIASRKIAPGFSQGFKWMHDLCNYILRLNSCGNQDPISKLISGN